MACLLLERPSNMKRLRSKRMKLALVGGLLSYNLAGALPGEALASSPARRGVALKERVELAREALRAVGTPAGLKTLVDLAEEARARGDVVLYGRLLRLASALLQEGAPRGNVVVG